MSLGCRRLFPHVVVGAVLEKFSTVVANESTGELVTVLSRNDATGWVLVTAEGWLRPREVPIECLRLPVGATKNR